MSAAICVLCRKPTAFGSFVFYVPIILDVKEAPSCMRACLGACSFNLDITLLALHSSIGLSWGGRGRAVAFSLLGVLFLF